MHNLEAVLSHPYLGTPVAIAAVVNPVWVDILGTALPLGLQILGGVFLIMQIYYIFKNKGKK